MRQTPARSAAIDSSPAAEKESAIDPRLFQRFNRALERFSCGTNFGVAVSGGPDSMALLLLAYEQFGDDLKVATVNHGLRPEAAEECALVTAACEKRGIECTLLNVQLEAGNIQSRAREARYAALIEWAEGNDLGGIATAHHADDQAETFMMRLVRGSGLQGLAGIRPERYDESSKVAIIRPLLEFRRSELRTIVEQSGEAFVDDPSNHDEQFDRVRMRKVLAGADWLDPSAVTQSAQHLGEAEATLASIARDYYLSNATRDGEAIILPFLGWHDTNARMIQLAAAEFKLSLAFGEVMELVKTRLVGSSKANIGGVLIEKTDVSWRVSREPPRRTG